MDFARKQLEKYGWTDGKGLGKNEDGISAALKLKLKRSVAGIGHDAASEFTEHWWAELYNKAAGNVQVEERNGKTKKIKTKDKEFKITNSTWKINKKQSRGEEDIYSNHFVKKAVLSNGGSKLDKVNDTESDTEDIVKTNVFKMTDEELFVACEGRTAHKGARHGIKAVGKLARIERQEQMLLKQPQYNKYLHSKKLKEPSIKGSYVIEDSNLNYEGLNSSKKKKKLKHCFSNDVNINELNVENSKAHTDVKTEESLMIDNNENDVIIEKVKKAKREESKKRKSEVKLTDGVLSIDHGITETNEKVNKRKKKKKLSYVV